MTFVQLHNHSDYSFLDGESSIEAMVTRAVQLEQPAIAITDHGVMTGVVELLLHCLKQGIKAILGCEFYLMDALTDKRTGTEKFNKSGEQRFRKYHQTILALNRTGYSNLVKLNNFAHIESFRKYSKKAKSSLSARSPITREKLQECSEGLVVLSGCRAGVIPQAILANQFDYALELAQWYKDVFGDRFFLEIQDHGYPEDRVVNVALFEISKQLGIKLVATNDSHFTDCFKVERHDALLAIGTGKLLDDTSRMQYSGTEYLKSADEMRLLFRDHLPLDVIEEAIANTVEIANRVEDYGLLTDKMQEPEFPIPDGYDTQEDYLRFLSVTGLHRRFPDGIPPGYEERLNTELKIIADKGFSGYMLIVWDIVRWAKQQDIPVGMGRGSVGGSLVAWVIDITGFDPIKYDCLFERFINPERKSYPDIDLDFCVNRRQEVFQYVIAKYGNDCVCTIGTIGRLKSKAAIQDVGRILNMPPWERDAISKMIPSARGKTPSLKTIIEKPETAPELYKLYESNPKIKKWLDLARMVEGVARNGGIHAAGALISAVPLNELVPVYMTDAGDIVCQLPKDDVEAIGLLKMDLLGVAELSTIRMTQELIFANYGIWIDVENLDLQDPKTFALFQSGNTEGVFQFESAGMRQMLIAMCPRSIKDLGAATALYRPGPLDTGMVELYIRCKQNSQEIVYRYPQLEAILGYTYSTVVFQEQVMKLCQEVGGYSLGQADLVRRAMGKKKPAEMVKHKAGFIKGAIERGFDPEWADKLWCDLEKYAEYCFNVPHAIGYSFTSYQTAYLKAHYPVEYLAATLTEKIGKRDDVTKYLHMAAGMGIDILPPDINHSEHHFTVEGNVVRFGLGAISHVGAIASLISKLRNDLGNYTSLADFCGRVLPNKTALNALIQSGALDSLNPNRNQMALGVEAIADWIKAEGKRLKEPEVKDKKGQLDLFDHESFYAPIPAKPFPILPSVEDYTLKVRLELEREFLGFYLSGHPLDDLDDIQKLFKPMPLGQLEMCREGQVVCCLAYISATHDIYTKKGLPMSFLLLNDVSGEVEAIAFPDFYEANASQLQVDNRLVVTGKVQRRDGKTQLILSFVQSPESSELVLIHLSMDQVQDRRSLLKIQQTLDTGRRKAYEVPIIATIPEYTRKMVILNPKYWVEDAQETSKVLGQRGFDTTIVYYELGQSSHILPVARQPELSNGDVEVLSSEETVNARKITAA